MAAAGEFSPPTIRSLETVLKPRCFGRGAGCSWICGMPNGFSTASYAVLNGAIDYGK